MFQNDVYVVINLNWGKLTTIWPLKLCSKGIPLGNTNSGVGWGGGRRRSARASGDSATGGITQWSAGCGLSREAVGARR